ncbi:MAG TPA: gas vesicle protein GvpD P-loop domain-containing protein [Nitrososphaeraceae archaeon]|nr:gas vesicle protein GvpD P-loop domain-containing protein [Nitrososphaeraceae archaeon]
MVNRVNMVNHNLLDIPSELEEFMKNDTYSLLVKGPSGSGKTTFSLTILHSIKAKNNFFYISTRSSPKQIFEQYPWLRKFVKEPSRDIDSPEVGQNLSAFEDARLDEPESLFERVTNQLMDVKNPVIIIDSWDSVASLMDREARLNNERVLQTWRERAKAKLIFTTEESVESSLENIVDGVVELNYELKDGLRIRSLFLKKLRGIPIKRSLYLFTLKDGIMRCFHSYDVRDFKIINNDNISKEKESRTQLLQSGYHDLDNYVGSTLPQNGLITIEKDDAVSNDAIVLFLNDLLQNFSRMNYTLLLDSTLGTIVTAANTSKSKNQQKLYLMDELELQERFSKNDLRRRNTFYKYVDKAISSREKREKIVAMMESGSMASFMSTTSDIDNYCRYIKRKFELSFLILNSNYSPEKYYSLSDIHLKFILICGTLFLKCSTPASALFGIKVVNSIPQIQLDHVL